MEGDEEELSEATVVAVDSPTPPPARNADEVSDTGDDTPLVAPFSNSLHGFTIAVDQATYLPSLATWHTQVRRMTSLSELGRGRAAHEISAVLAPGQLHGVISIDSSAAEEVVGVIAGFREVDSGSVMANGIPVISAHFREHVGFIGTNWQCIGDVTVADNLYAAIALRTDTYFDDRLAAEAAELLGVAELMDSRVSDLPAGARKRVAIAMEMTINPSVLILVEPLAGVSRFEHQDVIAALRRVANSGRTVIVSLRTLPWGLFEALDTNLLLAADGRQLFFGDSDALVDFLSRREAGQLAGGEAVEDLMSEWDATGEAQHVAAAFSRSEHSARLRRKLAEQRELQIAGGFRPVRKVVPPAPRFVKRFARMLTYTLFHSFRRSDFILSWGALFVCFFFCAVLQHRQHDNQDGMQNKRGIIFFLLSCAMYINVIFVDSEIVDRQAFVHLRDNRYFAPLTFFSVSVLRLSLPRLGFSIVAVTFARFIFSSAVPLAIFVGLTSFAHAALMLLVVFLRPVAQDVVHVLILFYAYSVMFSGFLINLLSMPHFFSLFSLLRPGYGGAVALELRGRPYSCDALLNTSASGNGTSSYCYSGDAYLALQGFSDDTLAKDALWLLGISALLLAGVAACMKWL